MRNCKAFSLAIIQHGSAHAPMLGQDAPLHKINIGGQVPLALNSFDIFLTIGDIQVRTLRVSVLCVKLSGVVIYRAASNPCTDRSFHSFTPFRRASGVPLLLSAKVTQKHF